MRTKIVERESGNFIFDGKDEKSALLRAIRKNYENSEMAFVLGDPNIEMHYFASYWQRQYSWLTDYLTKKNADGWNIAQTEGWLEIWRQIRVSRETARINDTAPPLAKIFGSDLATDIDLLFRLDRHNMCRVIGPSTRRNWAEARRLCNGLAKRFCDSSIELAFHEKLGVLLIAPKALIRHTFDVKSQKNEPNTGKNHEGIHSL